VSDALKKNDEELPPLRRFWKSRRDLPSVVWDPQANKPAFEFTRGVLDTRDQRLAEKLIELGYMEVELDEGENIKPPLSDIYEQPDPMPIKGRRVPQGKEHEPQFRAVKREQPLPRGGKESVPKNLTCDPKIVQPPKPVG